MAMRVSLRQAPDSPAAMGKAALAVARATGLQVHEARLLLAARTVIPAPLDDQAAAQLCQALTAAGLEASAVSGPAAAATQCAAHPALDTQGPCSTCRAAICAVCALAGDPPRCLACNLQLRRRRRFRNIRVALLGVVLISIGGWAVLRNNRLDARTRWARAVHTKVVLVAQGPISPAAKARWEAGLGSLDEWFVREWERYRPHSSVPMVTFALAGSVQVPAFPTLPGTAEGLADRVRETIAFGDALNAIDAQAGDPSPRDATIYVMLRPNHSGGAQVEGVAEAGGRRGIVEGSLDAVELALELTAVAHELLHLLGASDKYDAAGHALLPQGLPEPDAVPVFPQRAAEVMVGEIAIGPGQGKPITRLEDVRIGPVTAREIRW
jgi:hypothetical protein